MTGDAIMTDVTYMVRLPDERRFGPAPLPAILEWAREGRVPADALLEPTDDSPVQSVLTVPELARILGAPPTVSPGPAPPTPGPALIPTKNPTALIGYYTAVFSIIFFFLAPIAVILGLAGLVRVRRHPESRGTVHAWIAVIGGLLVIAFWAFIFTLG
ncbi:MAG: DUF4190 domain-containing protein [Planctomycetes bacterium]|nr:DUF4190 domain-containing protein [Planctomycetota bacterium]